MKCVLFHPTLLPPRDYGGVERVVLWLAKGLQELGHDVFVAAFAGSRLPGGVRLLPIDPSGCSALDLLPRLPRGVDVVHFMAPPEAGTWEKLPCSGLLTVHGNGKKGERFPKNSVFLSADHAKRHGAQVFVHNGIDPEEYEFNPKKDDAYLFLSKTSWRVKNVNGAYALCHRAGVRLNIAGGNRPFGVRLRAALDPRTRWVGPVAGKKKAELLSKSKALVFPILWPEPFGLVAVEALMSGTPVLASPRGSLPELITQEVGALPQNPDEWDHWLRRDQLPWAAEQCRELAMKRFHYLVMAKAYELLYQQVQGGAVLNRSEPIATGWRME